MENQDREMVERTVRLETKVDLILDDIRVFKEVSLMARDALGLSKKNEVEIDEIKKTNKQLFYLVIGVIIAELGKLLFLSPK